MRTRASPDPAATTVYVTSTVQVTFYVSVPANVAFEASTVNGDVEVEDLASDMGVTSVNGDIEISTTGFAGATTVNGSIAAAMGQYDIEDGLSFTTVNGSISLELPDDVDADLDAMDAVELPLRAGEAALFNNAICHASGPNLSDDTRIIFIIEMIPTHAYQHEPRESAMLVRGLDAHHNFDVDPRPESEMSPAALDAWRRKIEIQASVLYRGAGHGTRAFRQGDR